ncbi:hypothetical protein MJO29_006761 [Puccinia striiformis f. sp. tritici]|nr:hypothetical protein MJO29_006761 [Puccinia striiformis f. sp. tritici]
MEYPTPCQQEATPLPTIDPELLDSSIPGAPLPVIAPHLQPDPHTANCQAMSSRLGIGHSPRTVGLKCPPALLIATDEDLSTSFDARRYPHCSPLPPASSPATSRPPATAPLPTSARHQEDSYAANSERDRAQVRRGRPLTKASQTTPRLRNGDRSRPGRKNSSPLKLKKELHAYRRENELKVHVQENSTTYDARLADLNKHQQKVGDLNKHQQKVGHGGTAPKQRATKRKASPTSGAYLP